MADFWQKSKTAKMKWRFSSFVIMTSFYAKILDWHIPPLQERFPSGRCWHILCGSVVPSHPRRDGEWPGGEHCSALHVFLRLPSLPLRVVLFLFAFGSLLLSETEWLRHWQRTEGFSLVGHRPSSSWHIHYRVKPHTYATSVESSLTTYLRLGQRFRILLRLNYLAQRERERELNLT